MPILLSFLVTNCLEVSICYFHIQVLTLILLEGSLKQLLQTCVPFVKNVPNRFVLEHSCDFYSRVTFSTLNL